MTEPFENGGQLFLGDADARVRHLDEQHLPIRPSVQPDLQSHRSSRFGKLDRIGKKIHQHLMHN